MKLSTQILLGFFIAITIDLLDSYVNHSLTFKVKSNMEFLNNSEVIIRNSSRLNKEMVDMQSAFRGFLLTGDEHFLLSYYNGLRTIPMLVDQEEKLISPSSPQRNKLDSIVALHKQWINYANLLIEAKRNSQIRAKRQQYQNLFDSQFRTQAGKNYNDKIADIFASFNQYEYNVREELRKALSASIKRTETFSIFFSLLLIVIVACIAYYLVQKISRRINSMVLLAENISQGNFTRVNDKKKDELNGLSISLNTMSDKLNRNIHDLEKKNEELNRFAYVVSHDLKAPVRGINNIVQWIREDYDKDMPIKIKDYLEIIPQRLKRMENLIDGLLEYARVGSEKQSKEMVDVAVLVNELAEVNIPKEYKFFANNLPKLHTEKLLLEQVFSNLISNAVKYTTGISPTINIFAIENDRFFEFTVNDNGPGIDEEYYEKIFEIFQTLREKHDKESTGIGLSIVKKIIEDKHCNIKVLSSATSGTSFIFTWPK